MKLFIISVLLIYIILFVMKIKAILVKYLIFYMKCVKLSPVCPKSPIK